MSTFFISIPPNCLADPRLNSPPRSYSYWFSSALASGGKAANWSAPVTRVAASATEATDPWIFLARSLVALGTSTPVALSLRFVLDERTATLRAGGPATFAFADPRRDLCAIISAPIFAPFFSLPARLDS